METYPFVDLDTDWTARSIVDDAFARCTAFALNDVHMLLDLVRLGLGPALVPASYAAKPQADGLIRRPMPDPDLSWVVHFVTGTDASRPAQLFADVLVTADAVQAMRTGLSGVPAAPR
ncbi:LysR substrate-binding domain-containing protein [Saccharopolyspora sp. K220]|nr:LysR substrate-binding domain-containing protein [Saccharopolyspora soli]